MRDALLALHRASDSLGYELVMNHRFGVSAFAILLTACLFPLSLGCESTGGGSNRRASASTGDGLWAQLDQSRRAKESRSAGQAERRARLEGQLERGRAQVPAAQRRKMEAWWKEFLKDDPRWLNSRVEWRGLGSDPQEILVENLLIVVVRAFETNQGRLYQRARAELFDLAEPAIPYLVNGLAGDHGDDVTRLRCVEVLSDIGTPALPALFKAYEDSDEDRPRLSLLRAIAAMGEHAKGRSTEFLAGVALDEDLDFRLRLSAVEGLGATRDKGAIQPLLGCLRDDDLSVRKFAAAALSSFRTRSSIGGLVEAMVLAEQNRARNPREAEVIANCRRSLKRVTGRNFNSTRQWQAWWQTR
jgi:HEAT repeat protein